MKDLESLYEKAIKEPSFRQEFVNSLDFGGVKQYISGISVKEEDEIMVVQGVRKNPIMRCLSGEEIALSKIEIFPVAFEGRFHRNVYDFLSTLKFHEGFHAYENYYRPRYYQSNLFMLDVSDKSKVIDLFGEIRAEENTLKNLTSKNSLFYFVQTMELLKNHKECVTKIFNKV